MTMRIEVMSRKNAILYSQKSTYENLAIISISDCNKEFANFENVTYLLRLKFDDVEQGDYNCITFEQAVQIKLFVNSIRNNVSLLIVHCEAGISRSAGIAAALMKVIYGHDWKIFESNMYCPNMTCYRIVLDAFHDNSTEDEINAKEAKSINLFREKHNLD